MKQVRRSSQISFGKKYEGNKEILNEATFQEILMLVSKKMEEK